MDSKSTNDECGFSMLPPCGHGPEMMMMMMETMRRQQELVMQLRALVLPLLLDYDTSAGIAVQLFDDVIGCNISVASKLEAGCRRLRLMSTGAAGADGGGPVVADELDKSLVRKTSNTPTADKKTEERAKPNNSVGQKRRRNEKRSRSLVTHVPHYDGHQWRKYGQKNINGRQHPRSYYRCAYRERNCLATKTVEQQKLNNGGAASSAMEGEEISKYTVVYYGDHTCKDHSIITVQPHHQLANRDDLQNVETDQIITTDDAHQEPGADLDLPALLEVLDNSLISWEDWCGDVMI